MPVTRGCAFARRGGADRVFLLPPQVEIQRERERETERKTMPCWCVRSYFLTRLPW